MRNVRLSSALDWQSNAACAGMDVAIFFPDARGRRPLGHKGSMPRNESQAKEICAGCPVQAECLDYGLRDRYGVWGGLGEDERDALRKRQGTHAIA